MQHKYGVVVVVLAFKQRFEVQALDFVLVFFQRFLDFAEVAVVVLRFDQLDKRGNVVKPLRVAVKLFELIGDILRLGVDFRSFFRLGIEVGRLPDFVEARRLFLHLVDVECELAVVELGVEVFQSVLVIVESEHSVVPCLFSRASGFPPKTQPVL